MTPRQSLPACALAVLALAVLDSCSGSSSDPAAPAPPTPDTGSNSGPEFLGARSAVTAGGERIALTWEAARDDADPAEALVYDVYLSSTAGGFDFLSAPAATSAPGATVITLSSADSSLIASGTTVHAVVRARDAMGARDDNVVEVAAQPMPTGAIAYVTPTGSGAPAIGDPGRPFATIQAAVAAVPSSGGVVVVGAGTYGELIALTDAGSAGSTIAIHGGFDAAAITGSASPQALLDAYRPEQNVTRVDGGGLVPSAPQIGLIDVRNGGRVTMISGLVVDQDDLETGIALVDARACVQACEFVVGAGGVAPVSVRASTAGGDDLEVDLSGNRGTGLQTVFAGDGSFARLTLCGNRFTATVQSVVDAEPTIPDGVDAVYRFDSNEFRNVQGHAVDLDFAVETVSGPGTTSIEVCGNTVTAVDGNAFRMTDFGEHGSWLSFLSRDNFFAAGSNDCYLLRLLPGVSYTTEFVSATDVSLRFVGDTAIQTNSGYLELYRTSPTEDAEWDVQFDSLSLQQFDNFAIEVRDSGGSATFSTDLTDITTTVRDCLVANADGFVQYTTRSPFGGSNRVDCLDNVCTAITEETFEIRIRESFSAAPSQFDLSSPNTLNVLRNTLEAPVSDDKMARLLLSPAGPGNVVRVHNNVGVSERGVLVNPSFEDVPGTALDVDIRNNDFASNGSDPCLMLEVTGWLLTNRPKMDARVLNNRLGGAGEVLFVRGACDLDGGALVVAYNEFSRSNENELSEYHVSYGDWTILHHGNMHRAGGDDTEPGIDVNLYDDPHLRACDFRASNNLLWGCGSGIAFASGTSSRDAGRIVNNTVVFCGQSSNSIALGSHGSAVATAQISSGSHVLNNVSFGNLRFDLPRETQAIYSLIGVPEAVESLAPGSFVSHDPGFAGSASILDPASYVALVPSSPAVDAGHPAAVYADPDGSPNDMGVFGGPGAGQLGPIADGVVPMLCVGLTPSVEIQAYASPIGATDTLTLAFSENVDGSTLGAITFARSSGTVLDGTMSVDGRRVDFTPLSPWPAGEEIVVTVDNGLRSTLGGALAFAYSTRIPVRPPTAAIEVESNDSIVDAQALTGKVAQVDGTIASNADLDTYSLALSAGDRVRARVEGPDAAARFLVRLWASDGTTLLYEHEEGTCDGAVMDYTVTDAGTYFVQVLEPTAAAPYAYRLDVHAGEL